MIQFNIAPESFRGLKINDEYSMLDGIKYKIEKDDIVLKMVLYLKMKIHIQNKFYLLSLKIEKVIKMNL
jgi:hypothetical protein